MNETRLTITRESLYRAQRSVRWLSILVLLMTITLVWQLYIFAGIQLQAESCSEVVGVTGD